MVFPQTANVKLREQKNARQIFDPLALDEMKQYLVDIELSLVVFQKLISPWRYLTLARDEAACIIFFERERISTPSLIHSLCVRAKMETG